MKIVMFLFLISSCSMFFGSSDAPKSAKGKAYTIRFTKPGWYYQVNQKSDYVFENSGGQVLLANSFCDEFQTEPLERLAEKTFTGVNDFKASHKEYTVFNKREAYQIKGSGFVDGVKINLMLLNTRRDHCYYDFLFISPQKEKVNPEDFSDFLKTVVFS